MDALAKLRILTDAAKYDAACTSSGVDRPVLPGQLGGACKGGICHSFAADGRCITLLKVLMTNVCVYDCAYCANRVSNEIPRASFKPRELADLTIEFYRRNYIEGLFLSSGVARDADYAGRQMLRVIKILRDEYQFNGYIHAKAIPGASPETVQRLGFLVDRLSVNIELPSERSLRALAPDKDPAAIGAPLRQIRDGIAENSAGLVRWRARRESRNYTQELSSGSSVFGCTRFCAGRSCANCRHNRNATGAPARFAPAGQATQMIIGASPETDYDILQTSAQLYERYKLKRVFFSAYLPVGDEALLPAAGEVPLVREHRLYQADWLLRYYGFSVDEIITADTPQLDPLLDPKCMWALRHLERFPLEVNKASYEELLRVPGIGVTGAKKIVRARRARRLDFDALRRLRIVLKRAAWFITASGKYMQDLRFDPELIYTGLTADESQSRSFQTVVARQQATRQLRLFDEPVLSVSAQSRQTVLA
jgi:putative DNA modification/repair radical SAM protein